jgi:hypothetical protein
MMVTRAKKRQRQSDDVGRQGTSSFSASSMGGSQKSRKTSKSGSTLATKSKHSLPPCTRGAAVVQKIESQLSIVDLADRANAQAAVQYAAGLFDYHRQVELRYAPSPTYMTRQADINDRMRAILIDWLIEVHLKFKLELDTLFLTVQLIDRFLQCKTVWREKLQLVGVSAMLIASKFEEIYAPEVRDFVYISDNAYSHEEVVAMESLMLNCFQVFWCIFAVLLCCKRHNISAFAWTSKLLFFCNTLVPYLHAFDLDFPEPVPQDCGQK